LTGKESFLAVAANAAVLVVAETVGVVVIAVTTVICLTADGK